MVLLSGLCYWRWRDLLGHHRSWRLYLYLGWRCCKWAGWRLRLIDPVCVILTVSITGLLLSCHLCDRDEVLSLDQSFVQYLLDRFDHFCSRKTSHRCRYHKAKIDCNTWISRANVYDHDDLRLSQNAFF